MTRWIVSFASSLTIALACSATLHADPIQIDAIAAYFPGIGSAGSDLRLGAGIVVRDGQVWRARVEAFEHAVGAGLSYRIPAAGPLEVTIGVTIVYELPDHRWRPGVTLARLVW